MNALAIVLGLGSLIYLIKTSRPFDDRIEKLAMDGNIYKVRDTLNSQQTADTLARLNAKVLEFISRLYVHGDQGYEPVAIRLKQRYKTKNISEGVLDHSLTSYTVNKGEEIVYCMSSRDELEKPYDDNLLFYVTLHELSHVASISEGHNEEFYRNFRYLIKKATEFNMFKHVTTPVNYCGIPITKI